MPDDEPPGDFEELFDKAESALEEIKRIKREGHAYFGPSDEPLDWDTSGLVRLDHLIVALYLMCARIAVVAIPGLLVQKLTNFVRDIGDKILARGAAALSLETAKSILKVLTQIERAWDAVTMEMEIEKAIRRAAIRTQRELFAMRLGRAARRRTRKTHRVLTRHPIPKQRKANKSWQRRQRKS